ncbi:glycosyltransferase [Mesorhizobium sp.]|uniref:glycosyltransferase n=1 Tax=Mesorhizobium sp. TaxID=1871066 RepID=UPI000FE6F44E|nr:glycosyltransferase [Mesorhizobium sp.]RWA63643.1 MAG: glycosyltransferase [Mesorhizobium sp.]
MAGGIVAQYSDFEERFRGNRDSVLRTLAVYLPLLDVISRDSDANPMALDLGSGRGEWCALLKDRGWLCTGVENNPGMTAEAERNGIISINKDALDFVKNANDESYHVVTAFHLLEHLESGYAIELLENINRILKPGGLFIVETPNPENLAVASWAFHMDPTHIRPIPPPLMVYYAELAGFRTTRILRLNGKPAVESFGPIQSLINTLFNLGPDYGLVALKQANLNTAKEAEFAAYCASIPQQGPADMQRLMELARDADAVHVGLKDMTRVLEESRREQDLRDIDTETFINAQQEFNHVIHVHIHELKTGLSNIDLSWILRQPFRRLRGQARSSAKRILFKSKIAIKNQPNAWILLDKATRRFPRLRHYLARKSSYPPSTETYPTLLERGFLIDFPEFAAPKITNLAELSVKFIGHFNGTYSLAYINRNLVEKLHSLRLGRINIIPFHGRRENAIVSPNSASTATLTRMMRDEFSSEERYITLVHHFPVLERSQHDRCSYAMFFWEESSIPSEIIEKLNGYDAVLTPSQFVMKTLQDNGCQTPIVLAHPPVVDIPAAEPRPHRSSRVINLLHISSCFPRKGVDVLLSAFDIASQGRDLQLTIKTFPNEHNNVDQLISDMVSAEFRKNIRVIYDEYTTEQMQDLYDQHDAIVLPSRGEGLNLPAIEAGLRYLPVVATGFGGQADFLTDGNSWRIPFHFTPSVSHLSKGASFWAEPDQKALADILGDLIDDLDEGGIRSQERARLLFERVSRQYGSNDAARRFLSALHRAGQLEAPYKLPLGLTIVSTWREQCGIADYSERLIDSLGLRDVSVIAPQVDSKEIISSPSTMDYIEVTRSWMKNAPRSGFANQDLSRWKEVVWFQHHFAFYEIDRDLHSIVKKLKALGKSVFITLHTSQPILQFDSGRRSTVTETLRLFDRVIVHTVRDLNNLGQCGLGHNVTVVPQGIPYRGNVDISEKLTKRIGSFGFLYEHKNVKALIEGFAYFVAEREDGGLFKLCLVNSVRTDANSKEEFERCRGLIHSMGLERQVEFYSHYLEEWEVEQKLSECDLVVLPYQENPESSSAAVRAALAACPFVATSPAHLFDEVRDITLALKGFSPMDITAALREFYDDPKGPNLEDVARRRMEWAEENSWARIGQRSLAMMRGVRIESW